MLCAAAYERCDVAHGDDTCSARARGDHLVGVGAAQPVLPQYEGLAQIGFPEVAVQHDPRTIAAGRVGDGLQRGCEVARLSPNVRVAAALQSARERRPRPSTSASEATRAASLAGMRAPTARKAGISRSIGISVARMPRGVVSPPAKMSNASSRASCASCNSASPAYGAVPLSPAAPTCDVCCPAPVAPSPCSGGATWGTASLPASSSSAACGALAASLEASGASGPKMLIPATRASLRVGLAAIAASGVPCTALTSCNTN